MEHQKRWVTETLQRLPFETIIKEIGGEHYVEKMKFYEVGSIEVEPTYYHVFNGQLKNGGYHIIFFNNKQEYLGFYYSDYEPTDYEEGAVLLLHQTCLYFHHTSHTAIWQISQGGVPSKHPDHLLHDKTSLGL